MDCAMISLMMHLLFDVRLVQAVATRVLNLPHIYNSAITTCKSVTTSAECFCSWCSAEFTIKCNKVLILLHLDLKFHKLHIRRKRMLCSCVASRDV